MNRFVFATAAAALILPAAAPQAVQAQGQQQQQQQMQQQQPPAGQSAAGRQQVMLLPAEQIDPAFAYAAAEAGMAEVQVSQLATQQAKNQQVVDFAEQMIQDHTRANQQLMQVAQQVGAQVPQHPGAKHLLAATALAAKQGAEFDEAYIKGEIRDHEEAIGLYEFAANNAQNQQLRSFAQDTLPTLQQHLEQARQVAQQLGIEA